MKPDIAAMVDQILREMSEPNPIEDFDPTYLMEGEWMALADHADTEVWVWSQMAEHEKDADDKARYTDIAAHYREKARLYREFAAIESKLQDEWMEKRDSA